MSRVRGGRETGLLVSRGRVGVGSDKEVCRERKACFWMKVTMGALRNHLLWGYLL